MMTSILRIPFKKPGLVSGRRNKRSRNLVYNRQACLSCELKQKHDERVEKILLDQLLFI